MNKKAYTLIELIVVIAIVLIITSAAIIGSSGINKNLRRGNIFNKIVFTVQRARNLASTGKNQAAHGVFFAVRTAPLADQITIFADLSGNGQYTVDDGEYIETINIDKKDATLVLRYQNGASMTDCAGGNALILYRENSSEVYLTCGTGADTDPEYSLMEFGIISDGAERTFLIHRAAGVPQAE